jgi:hypothetical protein
MQAFVPCVVPGIRCSFDIEQPGGCVALWSLKQFSSSDPIRSRRLSSHAHPGSSTRSPQSIFVFVVSVSAQAARFGRQRFFRTPFLSGGF